MPHIVIEYSDNLASQIQASNITQKLHQTVVDSNLFSPEAVKARSVGYSDYVLPAGADSFTHVTVSILTGRSSEERGALNDAVFAALKEALPEVSKLSSNIHEMDKETYRK